MLVTHKLKNAIMHRNSQPVSHLCFCSPHTPVLSYPLTHLLSFPSAALEYRISFVPHSCAFFLLSVKVGVFFCVVSFYFSCLVMLCFCSGVIVILFSSLACLQTAACVWVLLIYTSSWKISSLAVLQSANWRNGYKTVEMVDGNTPASVVDNKIYNASEPAETKKKKPKQLNPAHI